jgi:WD repeat-containing protein 48
MSPTALSTVAASTTSLEPPSSGRAYRLSNPGYLANEVPQRVRSISEITASQPAPSIVAAIATGPLTPAILPDLPQNGVIRGFAEDQTRALDGPLTPIPQSPLPSPSINAASPTPKGLPGQSQTFDDGDYFSARNQGNEKEKEKAESSEGAIASPGVILSATPNSPAPPISSSGGGGFIGRLRALGKSSSINAHLKKPTSETSEQEGPTVGSTTGDQEMVAEVKPPSPTVLSILLSKPLNRPPSSDVPPLSLSPLTNIILSDAHSEAASGWESIYQGLYGMQASEADMIALERELPEWVLEFLLANTVNGIVGGGGVGHSQKFSFLVVPWKGAIEDDQQSLPELLTKYVSMLLQFTLLISVSPQPKPPDSQ